MVDSVGTALALGGDLAAIVTYDDRMLEPHNSSDRRGIATLTEDALAVDLDFSAADFVEAPPEA